MAWTSETTSACEHVVQRLRDLDPGPVITISFRRPPVAVLSRFRESSMCQVEPAVRRTLAQGTSRAPGSVSIAPKNGACTHASAAATHARTSWDGVVDLELHLIGDVPLQLVIIFATSLAH